MVHGYVLIQTALGKVHDVVKEVSCVTGVKGACAVRGGPGGNSAYELVGPLAYDIVATINVKEPKDIEKLVLNIRCTKGVYSAITLICWEHWGILSRDYPT